MCFTFPETNATRSLRRNWSGTISSWLTSKSPFCAIFLCLWSHSPLFKTPLFWSPTQLWLCSKFHNLITVFRCLYVSGSSRIQKVYPKDNEYRICFFLVILYVINLSLGSCISWSGIKLCSFVIHVRKQVIQVWNSMSRWWQNHLSLGDKCKFLFTCPHFNGCFVYLCRLLSFPRNLLNASDTRRGMARAFSMWSDVSPFSFREVPSDQEADIKIGTSNIILFVCVCCTEDFEVTKKEKVCFSKKHN